MSERGRGFLCRCNNLKSAEQLHDPVRSCSLGGGGRAAGGAAQAFDEREDHPRAGVGRREGGDERDGGGDGGVRGVV